MDLTVWTHRYQLIMMVIGWFILCIIFWLIYRLNHQRFWLQTKLNKTVSIITIVICIICGIGMNLFVNGFLWLLPLGELFSKVWTSHWKYYESTIFYDTFVGRDYDTYYGGDFLPRNSTRETSTRVWYRCSSMHTSSVFLVLVI